MCQAAIFCRGWAKHENSESSQVDWKVETIFHCNLIQYLGKSPELFIEFICSCICCNWEASCWMVSWFSFNFCVENSSTCCTCAPFIFSNSCILRICLSRRAFSFRNNSSCNRVYSRLESTNPYCAVRPVTPIFVLPFVVVVHRCTCWGTRHEALASPGLILIDWASDPCFLQEDILSNSTE